MFSPRGLGGKESRHPISVTSTDGTVSYPICVYPKTTWTGTGSAVRVRFSVDERRIRVCGREIDTDKHLRSVAWKV